MNSDPSKPIDTLHMFANKIKIADSLYRAKRRSLQIAIPTISQALAPLAFSVSRFNRAVLGTISPGKSR
nr:hypothetical protein CFP56_57842 [Quercus suber]